MRLVVDKAESRVLPNVGLGKRRIAGRSGRRFSDAALSAENLTYGVVRAVIFRRSLLWRKGRSVGARAAHAGPDKLLIPFE